MPTPVANPARRDLAVALRDRLQRRAVDGVVEFVDAAIQALPGSSPSCDPASLAQPALEQKRCNTKARMTRMRRVSESCVSEILEIE